MAFIRRKKPGDVEVKGIKHEPYITALVQECLDRVCRSLPQHTRNRYDGSTHVETLRNGVKVTIRLKCKKDNTGLASHICVTDADIETNSPTDRRDVASALSTRVCDSVIAHERHCEGNLPRGPFPERYEPDKIKPNRPSKKKAKTKRKPKAKPVCPICGPEDDLYPPWEGACVHD